MGKLGNKLGIIFESLAQTHQLIVPNTANAHRLLHRLRWVSPSHSGANTCWTSLCMCRGDESAVAYAYVVWVYLVYEVRPPHLE